jgi:hypothetical protein
MFSFVEGPSNTPANGEPERNRGSAVDALYGNAAVRTSGNQRSEPEMLVATSRAASIGITGSHHMNHYSWNLDCAEFQPSVF